MSQRKLDDNNKFMCHVHNGVEKSQAEPKLADIKEEEQTRIDKPFMPNGDVSPQDRATQSRLLTKKQLSDMAMSVRSLAKKLGSLRVKLKIRTVFLLTKAHDQTLIGKTREVAKWLLSKERDVPYTVYVENTLEKNEIFDAAGLLKDEPGCEGRLKYWDNDLARRRPQTFDFVVTLGGDGTVLYASWLFQRVVPPVLSFALGSLGFLTKFDFDNYQETLIKAFSEGVTISLRLRFEGTIMRTQNKDKATERRDLVEELVGEEGDDHRTHKPDRTFEILNDIVVDRGPNPSKLATTTHQTSSHAELTCSNVHHRAFWRRGAFDHGASRRYMRRDTDGIYSLQLGRRRLPLPSRKPRHPSHGHMRPHTILPAYHPPRLDGPSDRSALRRTSELVGEL